MNGCCWLNHSNEKQCKKFIELVREHRCIKAWFSGHFHLGQDYQDSITVSVNRWLLRCFGLYYLSIPGFIDGTLN